MTMFQVSHRCPHCNEHKDFLISQASELFARSKTDEMAPLWTKLPKNPDQHFILRSNTGREADDILEFCGLSRCPHCNNPVLFIIIVVDREYRFFLSHSKNSRDHRIPSEAFSVVTTYPQAPRFNSHPSWPDKIKQPFVEMQEDVRRGRTPAFIIGNCRTILEAIMTTLGAKGPTLEFKIKDLRDKRLITLSLAEWAEKLRGLGNTAVHDFDGDAEDAKQLVEFIKLLLHVTFELPASIQETAPDVPLTAPADAQAQAPEEESEPA